MTAMTELCSADDSVLLVIDVQEKLVAAMPSGIIHKVIHNTNQLVAAANTLNVPVMHTEQYARGLGPTVATLTGLDNQPVDKTCFACSASDEFIARLEKENRRQVIIAGIEAHICVLQTAMQLVEKGYTVFVTKDAICSRSKHNYKNALQRLQQAGVIITNNESVMFEWVRDASHPEFKKISQLVK